MVRNIPTYVGMTLTDRRIPGTSPLAWGRLSVHISEELGTGNIPTSVGKTIIGWLNKGGGREHPH